MGNRAVICSVGSFDPKSSSTTGVYLHWNGGRASVEAFLKYCELKGYRSPDVDCYGWARLCQVIGNFFGGGLSIGVGPCYQLDCDNCDNGTYIIKGWEIVDRKYCDTRFDAKTDLTDMLIAIDQAQPVKEQLGEFLVAKEIPISEVQIGDEVFIFDGVYHNKYEKYKVVGYGEEEYVNGVKAKGVPYVNKYGNETISYASNCNNYLQEETVRVAKRKVKAKVSKA